MADPNRPESSERPSIAARLIDAQQRMLDLQRSTFDRGYDLMVSLQERQEEAVTSWLEKSDRVPEAAVELAETWIGAGRSTREAYRSSIDKSFELAHDVVEGLRR